MLEDHELKYVLGHKGDKVVPEAGLGHKDWLDNDHESIKKASVDDKEASSSNGNDLGLTEDDHQL